LLVDEGFRGSLGRDMLWRMLIRVCALSRRGDMGSLLWECDSHKGWRVPGALS